MTPRRIRLVATTIFLAVIATRSTWADQLDHTLFRAIRARNDRRVADMLRQGTLARLRGPDGTTALMVASLWGTADAVRLLLERGADASAANEYGATALHWGAGDLEKVRLLVEAGADVHARNVEGKTPLAVAVSYPNNDSVVAYLVTRGAEPDAREKGGEGPSVFQRSVASSSIASIRRLAAVMKKRGSFTAFSDREWRGILLMASLRGDTEILETLYELLPAKDLVNEPSGPLPIHAALVGQNVEAAHWLLDHGARVDVTVVDGETIQTLLMSTFFESGDASVAKAVLERGADPTASNEQGETALTWARRRGNKELIELLEKAGVPDKPDEPPAIPNRELDLHAGNRDHLIRQAVEGSVALMLKSSDTFLEKRRMCISCHNQLLPAIAAGHARDRGLSVDTAALERLTARQIEGWNNRLPRLHELDTDLSPASAAFRLWSLAAIGYQRDVVTDSAVRYITSSQQAAGHWTTSFTRPPMNAGDVQATALAIRALRDYPIDGREEDIDAAVGRAATWLRQRRPTTHQETVFRLLGLTWAGEDRAALEEDASALLALQRPDGGWAQFDGVPSDAWATGETLVALHAAGFLDARDPAYRRGIEFLLRTRFDDGSWFVQRRAFPFQVQFDSGFPFGRDQWISIGGTAWAVMALVNAIEPSASVVVPARSERSLTELTAPSDITMDESPADTPTGSAEESVADEASGDATPAAGSYAEPLDGEVTFQDDVAAVLARSCAGCHSGTLPEGELDVTSRRALLDGGESGDPAIVPGSSATSKVILAVTSERKASQMPPPDEREKYPALTEVEIAKLRVWIDRGAEWPEGATIAPPERTRSVEARRHLGCRSE